MKITFKKINVRRNAAYSIVINAVQIVAVWLLAIVLMRDNTRHLESIVTIVVAALVSLGAALDIREAMAARRKSDEADALGDMVGQMDELNRALRAQRHDFLNHLQVVYSLIEMEEYQEARDYIEKVYGDMQSVSRAMRTDSPAINALLRVKLADCENASTPWSTPPTAACASCCGRTCTAMPSPWPTTARPFPKAACGASSRRASPATAKDAAWAYTSCARRWSATAARST